MKSIISIILGCFLFQAAAGQELNVPLLISGRILNSAGTMIPGNQLRFKIFLEDEKAFYLTETSPSCGYQPPFWYAELGNVSVEWHFGDYLTLVFENVQSDEQVTYRWMIDSTAQIPELRTQKVDVKSQIATFSLSDRGVYHGTPVLFSLETSYSRSDEISLSIFSPQGVEIFSIKSPLQISANEYRFSWDGKSTSGENLHSGLYFYFVKFSDQLIHSGVVALKND
jgi:hypothetical protein